MSSGPHDYHMYFGRSMYLHPTGDDATVDETFQAFFTVLYCTIHTLPNLQSVRVAAPAHTHSGTTTERI